MLVTMKVVLEVHDRRDRLLATDMLGEPNFQAGILGFYRQVIAPGTHKALNGFSSSP